MTTLKKLILVAAIAVPAIVSNPATAQQSTPRTVNNQGYVDDDTDRGMSPWWGLLGLVGLFGLMRRPDRTHLETNPGSHR
jgi:MYXO-CTERM domain-containing protein